MKKWQMRWQKICETCKTDVQFARGHRLVRIIMAVWMVIIAADRLIGVLTRAYDGSQQSYALVGGVILVITAYLGMHGFITLAMLLMELNMAVFLIQFCATCFFYRESAQTGLTVFYGIAAVMLIIGSLLLFLNYDIEHYREQVASFGGKKREPLFVRTNSRLIRNRRK